MVIENTKLIDAPPAIVWLITVDLQSWPEWTPTVESVELLEDKPFGQGSKARIKQPGLPPAVWRVTKYDERSGFTWEAQNCGMKMVATHVVHSVGAETRSILRLEVTGFVAFLLWPFIRKAITKALDQENTGLKTACEATAHSSRS